MGIGQMQMAITANKGFSSFERFPYIGLMKPHSADKYVPDSASGATALATGTKTNNGMLSMNRAGVALKTILEIAEEHDKATGIVATSELTHATPAAFVSHQKSYDKYEDIAADYVSCGVDAIFGGGLKYFKHRPDGRDLTEELKSAGFKVATDKEGLKKLGGDKVAGFLAYSHPPKMAAGRANLLGDCSEIALRALGKNKNGFFLMIESSQIEWAGHKNDPKYTLQEMLDFDKVIGQMLNYASKDKNTLVIVTTDNETGGLAITNGNFSKGVTTGKFATGYHTGSLVPVLAFGPGAEEFTGIFDNTQLFSKMLKAYHFDK